MYVYIAIWRIAQNLLLNFDKGKKYDLIFLSAALAVVTGMLMNNIRKFK